ncbi:hypothetical protein [Umezawaea sp. NPDC059074]|uniref:DUF7380 domain-containing protein n=1 Tax=Umezawaea sp. NPDC059074 TaxID=3346716 RepID=UPI0036AE28D5
MNPAESADAEPSASAPLPAPGRTSEPYRHDAALVPALARLADAACDGVADPHEASLWARQLSEQSDPAVNPCAANVVVTAFLYTLFHDDIPVAGANLRPIDGPSMLPVALKDTSGDIRAAWLALAAEVTHPVARARFYDIVFILRLMSNSRLAAERAARAYLDAVGGSQRLEAQATGLVRAWTLARSVGATALEQEVAEVMLGMAADLVECDDHPYVVSPLLCALIELPRRKSGGVIDPRVDVVLDRALRAYPQVHVIKDFAAIVRKRAAGDAVRVEAANRWLIEAMLAEARAAAEPMIVRTLFHEAASVARQLGVADLEKVAVAGLQAAPALNWESTLHKIDIPGSLFDAYLPGFNKATGWREALRIWLHSDSPTGEYEGNLATTQQVQQHSLIRYLTTTVLFRDGDMPARTLSGDDAVFARDLVRTELHCLGTYGVFLANALNVIAARFGIPPREELETFLRILGGDPTLMNVLATALQLFWVAEYDAAVHLAVLKVESAARALLLEINEPVYRAAVGDAAGQFPGLGSLLQLLLDNGFDRDWERFLRTFLLSDGSNVRNLVAHGFSHDIGALNAAVALRAMAVLALIAPEHAVRRDATTVRAALANPISERPRRTWWGRVVAAALVAWYEFRRC